MKSRWAIRVLAGIVALGASTARGDGPRDNLPAAVRRIPALGITVPENDRRELEAGLAALQSGINELRGRRDARTTALLPDVEIFHKAVHDALAYQEFFNSRDLTKARNLLKVGQRRVEQLRNGTAPWTRQTGLVVRGYVSKIDGSVQPYGLVVPNVNPPGGQAGEEPNLPRGLGKARLDVWFHGRGETLSEVNFLDERMPQPGQFTPPDTFVLHPYGRYCNAFRFAGEVDVLEAIEAVRRNYRIDDDRISVRGFSMGGAACWQFAVHYADRWFAANPGAGFSETAKFLKVFQKETLRPTWYEQALWHLYDSTDYAANLIACPTVAYSGALDSQKQAADVMAEALKAEGIELTHIIGPGTKHAYHPDARREVERRMASIAARGRDALPSRVQLTTYTLKYNKMHWLTIDALDEHWKRARVDARLTDTGVSLRAENVRALTLDFAPGWCPLRVNEPVAVDIGQTRLAVPPPQSDRSWTCRLHREGDAWVLGALEDGDLRKRHDLQGPIDDAFMDSFVFVRPTGKGTNPKLDAWVEKESARAVEHWRRQFRGEARVKDDTAVSDQDIASSNLVLWGDPSSNAVLKRLADRLPISWDGARIKAGDRTFAAADHALVLIYPNPLNPKRYVVLNSGFTYRDYDYLNNARQVPKLPDWAVIDLNTPPDSQRPGRVAAADFFGENWELRPSR
jgi:dienelactone hydrolase